MKKYPGIFLIFVLLFIPYIFTFAADYEKEGLAVPEEYPEELVPLKEGYKIVFSALDKKGNQQQVSVKYLVDLDIDTLGNFYQDVLSKGNLHNAEKMSNSLYMLEGELEGKTVNIRIMTERLYDNYQNNVFISITGDFGATIDDNKDNSEDVVK